MLGSFGVKPALAERSEAENLTPEFLRRLALAAHSKCGLTDLANLADGADGLDGLFGRLVEHVVDDVVQLHDVVVDRLAALASEELQDLRLAPRRRAVGDELERVLLAQLLALEHPAASAAMRELAADGDVVAPAEEGIATREAEEERRREDGGLGVCREKAKMVAAGPVRNEELRHEQDERRQAFVPDVPIPTKEEFDKHHGPACAVPALVPCFCREQREIEVPSGAR